ncbi:hypothetical protein [Actinomadura sp. 9N407]|uniref:hypothetical protein n=1 Tax=Actinomadura sp. 9N407 TaxID=3375154 RepID=UPI00379D6726
MNRASEEVDNTSESAFDRNFSNANRALLDVVRSVELILVVFAARELGSPRDVLERVIPCRDAGQLETWIRRAVRAEAAREIFGEGDIRPIVVDEPENSPCPFRSESARKLYHLGMERGRAFGELTVLLGALSERGLVVPDEILERVIDCTDFDQYASWQERAATAETVEDVFSC